MYHPIRVATRYDKVLPRHHQAIAVATAIFMLRAENCRAQFVLFISCNIIYHDLRSVVVLSPYNQAV